MAKYRDVFPKRHTLLLVVHVRSMEQALCSVAIAEGGGADGVFLINHQVSAAELLRIYAGVRDQFPTFWIGMNFLGNSPAEALRLIPSTANGLWTDNAGITEHGVSLSAIFFANARQRSPWDGLYFGGVAFKYQKESPDPPTAARIARSHMDVVTTSGAGTNIASDPKKISDMKSAIKDHPLAVASGIRSSNVRNYPTADCFVVASGVSYPEIDEFNPHLVRELTETIRSMS